MKSSEKLTKQELLSLKERFIFAKDKDDMAEIGEVMGIIWNNIAKYAQAYLNKSFHNYYIRGTEDMLHEAYFMIHTNFHKYDPNIAGLLTWARHHIHHGAQVYIDQNYTKTTAHYAQHIKKIKDEISKANKKGITLTLQEIIENTGISISTANKCLQIINNTNVCHIEANDYTEGNLMGSCESPEEIAIKTEEKDAIHRCINNLSEEEKKVILYKYGFLTDTKMNNSEISEMTGIKKENVRRIATNAERALKQSIKREKLFNNRTIKMEINNIGEEIIFIPKYNEIILKQTLESLKNEEWNF